MDVCAQQDEKANPLKKETTHSCKGQQLENKLLYLFVIYMSFLATIWHLVCNKGPFYSTTYVNYKKIQRFMLALRRERSVFWEGFISLCISEYMSMVVRVHTPLVLCKEV